MLTFVGFRSVAEVIFILDQTMFELDEPVDIVVEIIGSTDFTQLDILLFSFQESAFVFDSFDLHFDRVLLTSSFSNSFQIVRKLIILLLDKTFATSLAPACYINLLGYDKHLKALDDIPILGMQEDTAKNLLREHLDNSFFQQILFLWHQDIVFHRIIVSYSGILDHQSLLWNLLYCIDELREGPFNTYDFSLASFFKDDSSRHVKRQAA